MDKTRLIAEFSRAVIARSGIVFCGAGLSKPSGLPMWEEILDEPRKELKLPSDFTDLTLVAQYYIANIPGGRERLEAIVRSHLSVAAAPSRAHRLLSQIPVAEIWTTNYDTLLEQVLPTANVRRQDRDLIEAQREDVGVTICKMHGDFSIPESKPKIVISRDDFEIYPNQYPRMWTRLTSLFSTQTILFIGISFSDPNMMHLLSLTRSKFVSGNRQHYTIFKKPETKENALIHEYRVRDLESRGIAVIEVDDYAEIDDVLSGVVARAQPPYVYIGGSFAPDDKIDQFCSALGALLADTRIGVVSGGNRAGLLVSNGLGDSLEAHGRYDPSRILFYFQAKETTPPPFERRLGTIRFQGIDRDAMRELMIGKARAAVFIGGADGTRREIEIAKARGIPLIPIGGTGGAAAELWKSLRAALSSNVIGGGPISDCEFETLNVVPFPAAATAKSLIERAVFG